MIDDTVLPPRAIPPTAATSAGTAPGGRHGLRRDTGLIDRNERVEIVSVAVNPEDRPPRRWRPERSSSKDDSTMTIRNLLPALAILVSAMPACPTGAEESGRWYDQSRIESGKVVYAEHCAHCHGTRGEATPNWRKREADGTFPPPPLNGTAHAWHHPFKALARQIKYGAPGGTGKMPAFQRVLTDEEIINVIAWFQSLWPEEIYTQWWTIQQRASKQ